MRLRWLLALNIETSMIFGLLILVLAINHSPSLVAQQTYTNADVIKMVQAHLGASVIVEQIRSNPGHYVLTPDSLIRLQRAGVPDEVVQAMQAKKSPQAASDGQTDEEAGSRSSNISPPGKQAPASSSKWEIVNSENSLTGRSGSYLRMASVAGIPNGRFEVRASCDGDTYFTVTFTSLARGKAFSRSTVPTNYKGIAQGQPGGQCVHMSVAVGSADPIGYYSPFCDSNDDASVAFFGPGAMRKGVEITGQILSSSAPSPALASAFGPYLNALTKVLEQNGSPIVENMGQGLPMQHVINGDRLAVQLPFMDGSVSTVKLDLRDPKVHSYVAACVASRRQPKVEELGRGGDAIAPVGNAHVGKDFHVGKDYTVETFESALRQTLAKTARDRGLGDHYYDKDMDYISNAVETCSKLDSAAGKLDGPQYPVCKGGHGGGWGYESQHFFIGTFENVNASTATKYVNYHATGKEWVNERYKPNSILLKIDQIGDHKWGEGFYVWVKILEDDGRSMSDLLTDAYIKPAVHIDVRNSPTLKSDPGAKAATGDEPIQPQADLAKLQDKAKPEQAVAATQTGTASTSLNGGGSAAASSAGDSSNIGTEARPDANSSNIPTPSTSSLSTASPESLIDSVSKVDPALPVPALHDGVAGKALMKFLDKCSTGDAKGCEMVAFDVERGWGADRDSQAAKAFYEKACSLGRKSDCGK